MSRRAAENTKTGLLAVVGSFLVQTFFYIKNETTGSPLDLVAAAYFVDWIETIWVNMGFTGGVAAWCRDKVSPREQEVIERTQTATQAEVDQTPLKKKHDSPSIDVTYDWEWGNRSLKRMAGVDDDLVELITEALSYSRYDVGIAHLGGVRVIREQYDLLAQGPETTTISNSRHLHGYALDVIIYDENGKVTFDKKYYTYFEKCVAIASQVTGIPYEWGGHWQATFDGPHYQLPKRDYPDKVEVLAALRNYERPTDLELA